jgi:hypothetical protein
VVGTVLRVAGDAARSPGEEPTMEMRVFGRTGMELSVLGFGCGALAD